MSAAYSLDQLEVALAGVEEKQPPKRNRKPREPRTRAPGTPRVNRPRSELDALDFLNSLNGIARWAPSAFPAGKSHATGAWRITSAKLGRPFLEEDLSIAPDGICDFGQERGYTAVELLQHYFVGVPPDGGLVPATEFDKAGKPNGILSCDGACRWLAAKLGMDWDELRYEDIERDYGNNPPFKVEEFSKLGKDELLARVSDLQILKYGWPDVYKEIRDWAEVIAGIDAAELDARVDNQPNCFQATGNRLKGIL